MGIALDYGRARQRLALAVEWARSDRDVPALWMERTQSVASLEYITYTPMLGTAMLARATDDRVDTLSLKLESGPNAYSARTLCHTVLVPASITYGFDLRTTGREPLNNQPFFRYDRVDAAERVRKPASLAYLVRTLAELNSLSCDDALAALSAFLRARMQAAEEALKVQLLHLDVGVDEFVEAAEALLAEAEGGKRAQAVVAAVLEAVFDRVCTQRVNDPSRHLPGDVQGFGHNRPVLAVEVRAKPVTPTEVVQFGRSIARSGIERGMVAALSRVQDPLDRQALREQLWRDEGILMVFAESVEELVLGALTWCTRPISQVLIDLPDAVAKRLIELEVSPTTSKLWERLLATRQR